MSQNKENMFEYVNENIISNLTLFFVSFFFLILFFPILFSFHFSKGIKHSLVSILQENTIKGLNLSISSSSLPIMSIN